MKAVQGIKADVATRFEWIQAQVRRRLGGGTVRADAIRIYFWQFLGVGIGLLSGVLVARTLGPGQKGVVDLYRVLQAFILDFGLFGVGSGLLYQLANRGVALRLVHGTGLAFAVLAGGLMAAVGLLARGWVSSFFPGLPPWMILLAFALAPASYYLLLWSNIMTGLNRAEGSYRLSTLFVGVNLAVVLVLWANGQLSASTVVLLSSGVLLANAIVSFWILVRREPTLGASMAVARASLQFSLVVYLGFLANTLHFKIDQVMVSAWLGNDALGIYAVGVRWAEMLFLLDSAIIAAALYKISSSTTEEAFRLTKRIFRSQFLLSGTSGVLLAVVAYPLILIVYGETYRGAVLPLVLLIPGIVAWSLAKVMSQYISYNRGRQWYPTLFALGGMLLNVGLNSVMLPRFGIIGAGAASSLSYGLVMVATWIAFRRLGRPG